MEFQSPSQQTFPMPPSQHKARWIVVFIVCLIVLAAIFTFFNSSREPEMSQEDRFRAESSASSGSQLSTDQEKQFRAESSASVSSTLTPEQEAQFLRETSPVGSMR